MFLHVTAFGNRSRRPIENDMVLYKLRTDEQGRPQAHEVSFVDDRVRHSSMSNSPVVRALMIAAIFLALVACLALAGRLPLAVLAVYLVASATAFAAYAVDKSAAVTGQWRTPESTLHLLGLAGGWPGALIARHVLNHKSKKQDFIISFWATVILNCGALIWLLSPQASASSHRS